MVSRNWLQLGTLALTLLAGFGALVGHARQNGDRQNPAPSPIASMATVDMNRLYALSDAPRRFDQKELEINIEADQRLKAIVAADVGLLEMNELIQYVTLIGKAEPTAEEKTKIKELKALADRRTEELRTLQTKDAAQLTRPEQQRLRALAEQSRLFKDQVLPSLAMDFSAKARQKMEGFRNDQMAEIRTVVGQVAKEKSIAHVFDNRALVFTATDLTPLVLQRLNKRPNK